MGIEGFPETRFNVAGGIHIAFSCGGEAREGLSYYPARRRPRGLSEPPPVPIALAPGPAAIISVQPHTRKSSAVIGCNGCRRERSGVRRPSYCLPAISAREQGPASLTTSTGFAIPGTRGPRLPII